MALIMGLDLGILEIVKNFHQYEPLNDLVIAITSLGNGGLIWMLICGVLLIDKKTRSAGFLALFALILSTLVGEVTLKHYFLRPRPFITHTDIVPLIYPKGIYSFPSGHTTSSFAVAGVLSYMLSRHRTAIWVLACLISLSRVYLLVHYPTDIIFGAVIGGLCSILTIKLYNRLNRSLSNK